MDEVEFARQLRRRQTDAEFRLWGYLRDRRFLGLKFRRQVPSGRYVLDFYCHELRMAVELDGGQHLESAYDIERDAWLVEQGIRVVRFWNHDVLARTDVVLEALRLTVESGAG
ncbi:endonuclease domain-containing protein [Pseudomonas sp. PDM22]|uniref:endonuclease domain-containing protein n=1 Tax=Pseudomonas sp. PDM22 TaxID=2769287 RepID=UPI0009DAD6C6|nr:endonuclease domain-containing protein [Pseudomonas sp. PDM22]MBD9512483.1 endonuclease domain-containing protein [Pseudomonas sp. PDM22]OQR31195.1 DNA methyltransferase [Pseudomonas sp. T]